MKCVVCKVEDVKDIKANAFHPEPHNENVCSKECAQRQYSRFLTEHVQMPMLQEEENQCNSKVKSHGT